MEIIKYQQFEGLSNVMLEESFLLGIQESMNSIKFNIEAALSPHHPAYIPPAPDKQYCYKKISLNFTQVERLVWLHKTIQPIPNSMDDVLDYGNIDSMYRIGDIYHIEGEWGAIEFESRRLFVEVIDP